MLRTTQQQSLTPGSRAGLEPPSGEKSVAVQPIGVLGIIRPKKT
jgi:hypothetical protein